MKFSESHEWVTLDGETATVGISDYAQKELGEIVYVELPIEGRRVELEEEVVIVESTKSAVGIPSPLSGEILVVNASLREHPEKINQSAENEGWLFKLKMENPVESEQLMSESSYQEYINTISEK
ncbi:MAG: glycine cleavage system protein GcvH [Chlamydiales bacterium]